MDEATSALDVRSELLLKEALRNLMTHHTVTVSYFCFCFVVWPFQDSVVMHSVINILLRDFLLVAEYRLSSLLIDRKWC